MKKKWLKITLLLKLKADARAIARAWCINFEAHCNVKQLYFARYETPTLNSIEISAHTDASPGEIETLFKTCKDVVGVKVEERGDGSKAHAHAYQMVKSMTTAALPVDNNDRLSALADLIHWVCNMYGYDYVHESRFYYFAGFQVNSILIQNAEKALAEVKASADGHRSVRPKSSRAVSRKGRGKLATQSAE